MTTQKKNGQFNNGRVFATAIFFVVIVTFTIISIVKPKSDFSEAENRALQELPDLTADAVMMGEFQQQYEDYLSDQFIGREFFVNLTNQIMLATGKQDVNSVYLGAEDYLIEKYTMADFDEELVSDNIWYLSEYLLEMQDVYGKEHVQCMLVPSKGTVYKDYLPKHAVPLDTSYVVEELSVALGDENAVLDLTEVLSEHSEESVYYKTDHHWTTLGAYYGYVAYKNLRGEEATAHTEYQVTAVTNDFYGSTYDKVQIKKQADSIHTYSLGESKDLHIEYDDGMMTADTYYDESYLDVKDKYSFFLGGNFAKIKITTGTKNGKCLLLIKDSFSNSFVQFLENDYETIYMIDLRYTEGGMKTIMEGIQSEQKITDVLVMYNTEKLMQDDSLWKLE